MRSVVGRLLVAWATVATVVVPAPAGAGEDVAGVRAPDCGVRYLVPPNHGLNQTDGMALHGKGGLYVTQALYNRVVHIDLAGRLVRLDPEDGTSRVVAEGLPTRTAGIGVPLMNYSADVLVRRDGTIVASGTFDGSLVELAC